jgi:hypothetical protein
VNAPRLEILNRTWVSPPLVLAADDIDARIVVHVSGGSFAANY